MFCRTTALLVLILFSLPSGADEVEAGQLRIAAVGGGYRPALQLAAKAHFQVSGLVAHVRVEQQFRNDRQEWVEGEYLFPLPDQAAVNRLELVIGERVILGQIREKQAAREIYQQARKQGRKAGLVEQRRPNLFSNRIANIGPGETITVTLDYVQRIDYRDGVFSLRFPMTVTPRYTPAGHIGASEVWQYQHPQPATPGNPIQPIMLTAEINMGLPLAAVESPYHALLLSRRGGVYNVALADGPAAMDRDFLLTWRPQPGSEPQAAVFHERLGAEEYALLMVLPPSQPVATTVARELVFIIDTSGSMGGSSITQARASLDFALGQLTAADRFNIIEFNSHARALFTAAVDATPHNLARAREFVRHLDAGGGTEMRGALELALPLPARGAEEGERIRQVVFITDGAVGNEVELFSDIRQRLGGARLFTVGIGSAPNSWFMRKAAEFGRGEFLFIGDIGEVQQRMQALFSQLGQTLLVDISVDWPVAVETYPAQLPDLYPGEPLLVSARSTDSFQGSEVVISGSVAGQSWQRGLVFGHAVAGMEAAFSGIGTLWARRKIESLLDDKVLGRDESAVRSEVLPVALAHQLLSPYTSFIAVEQERSRPKESGLEAQPVANLRPHGQSPQVYSWPRTATNSRLHLLFGTLLLILTCVFYRWPASSWR